MDKREERANKEWLPPSLSEIPIWVCVSGTQAVVVVFDADGETR